MKPKLYFTGYSSALESKENGFYLSASIVVVTSWGNSVVGRVVSQAMGPLCSNPSCSHGLQRKGT